MGEYSLHLDLQLHPTPPFSSYHTSPHRKTINRWVGWEQLPARAARYLGKQASLLWFPGWKGRGQVSAWLSQSLTRTWKTWQRSPLPVTFIPLTYWLYTPPCTSLDTQTRGTESKTPISTKKLSVAINCSVLCTMCGFVTSNSPWLGPIVVWDVLTVG